jgi:ribA/ribD-fused uncharacterized protein
MKTIGPFTGEYRWLSNFWPCCVVFDGITYPSVEHAYQAAKTVDTIERCKIAIAPTPGDAKRFGKKITLREDWDEVKLDIMSDLLEQKFSNSELKRKLLHTKWIMLVELNHWHDNFWGSCDCNKCVQASIPSENNLGKLLMKLRASLRILGS